MKEPADHAHILEVLPKIEAIVVAFFGDEWLPSCIEFMQGKKRDAEARIVIVDNHGNQSVHSLSDGHGIVSLDLNGPMGFAEANNRALVALGFRSPLVCFLNQDTRSNPGWLSRAVELFARHPDLGAITPVITTYDRTGWDPNFADCARASPRLLQDFTRPQNLLELYDVPVVTAAAMIARTEVLIKVGGFDPLYHSYYEDYDLCHRIRDAGYRVCVWTGATVAHFDGSSTQTQEAELRRQRLVTRNRLIYRVRTSRNGRVLQVVRELFKELPRQLVRSLINPRGKPLFTVLGGHLDALWCLRRLLSERYDQQLRDRYFRSLGWFQ